MHMWGTQNLLYTPLHNQSMWEFPYMVKASPYKEACAYSLNVKGFVQDLRAPPMASYLWWYPPQFDTSAKQIRVCSHT